MKSEMKENQIGAVILGAGMSTRMGKPKLLLPWGKLSVIETIIETLQRSGLENIVLVTGASHSELADHLRGKKVTLALNPRFADGNMVHSLQIGLEKLQLLGCSAALLALGDQPQMQVATVKQVIKAGEQHPGQLILPSYQMKRGHPWIIPSALWENLLNLPDTHTMRDFINGQAETIHYEVVDTDSIFADLDTPEEYQREKPMG